MYRYLCKGPFHSSFPLRKDKRETFDAMLKRKYETKFLFLLRHDRYFLNITFSLVSNLTKVQGTNLCPSSTYVMNM